MLLWCRALRSGRDEVYTAIPVIAHRFGNDRAAVAAAVGQAAVMWEEKPLIFEADNSGMGCIGIAGYLADDAMGV